MATTTGDHTLTPPTQSQATPWTSTFVTFAQAITGHLDNLADVQIDLIQDSSDNSMLGFTGTASAVNYINMTNAATGTSVIMAAAGDDTNVDFNINPKGSGELVLDGLRWPNSDGLADQSMGTDGAGSIGYRSLLTNMVDDTSPQLAGPLDVNGQEITGAIDLHSTGDVILELGDSAGSNKVSVRDSGAVETASFNSDGDLACTDVTANSIALSTALAGTSIDINGTTEVTSVTSTDQILVYDSAGTANKKVAVSAFEEGINPWLYLSSTTGSGSNADVELTGTYTLYKLEGYNISPSDGFKEFRARMRNTGGSVKTGSTDYKYALLGMENTTLTARADSTADYMRVSVENVDQNKDGVLEVYIANPHVTALQTMIWWNFSCNSGTGAEPHLSHGTGHMSNAEANDLLRLYFAGGTYGSGTYVLYGLQE